MQQTIHLENALAEIHLFDAGTGVKEYHVMIHVDAPTLTFALQLQAVENAYRRLLSEQLKGCVAAFKRYFVSDATNQIELIRESEPGDAAWAVIQQPPLDGTKLALWVYLLTGVERRFTESGLEEISHGGYRHLWFCGANSQQQGSHAETTEILNSYVERLRQEGLTLERNCIRTWFFVNDVDNHYAGMVRARNEVFDEQQLTADTHFIASTGIGGRQADPAREVMMDAYAIDGIRREQVHYLYAASHLNRTSEYGVRFERGTYVDYGFRRKIFISGTASINNKGEIMYRGDIRRQTARMLENVETLLSEAGATYDDVEVMVVYLRDMADYTVVKQIYDERFPDKPRVFVNAPVCRPGWLIEMECQADKKISTEYPAL